MKTSATLVTLVGLILMSTNASTPLATAAFSADMIIVNAKVHTMDRSHPTAEAIAIHGKRGLWVLLGAPLALWHIAFAAFIYIAWR